MSSNVTPIPFNSSADYYSEDEISVTGNFELSLVGLGQSKCGCRADKRSVHVREADAKVLDKKTSAIKFRQLVREHCTSDDQYIGIMSSAQIKESDKKITTKQANAVAVIFHDILGNREFPSVD